MVRRITPQMISSYAKAFGVDTALKTKPVQVYIPKAKTGMRTCLRVDVYKEAFGVKSILETKKPDLRCLEPKADVESWIIEKFSPSLLSKGKYPKEYIDNPVTYVDLLDSFQKGSGTKAIKKIVRQSLKDQSEGRVALKACILDFEKGNPMGFYYKLGFRSVDEKYNKICEEWLKNGGKIKDRPGLIKYWIFAPQEMYLPKENIQQCLHYPEKTLKLCV